MLKFSVFLLVYLFADVTGNVTLGNTINIAEGRDLYLSLPNATSMYDTCKLYGPNDEQVTVFEVDTFNRDFCGYIVRNVNSTNSGTWTIEYGNEITYRATVVVNVLESINMTLDNLVWNIGSSIDVIVGPEDVIYCRVTDNNYHQVYEAFGPCRIVVDRVTMEHSGQWGVSVGIAGSVVLHQSSFFVQVGGARTGVTTNVAWNDQSVILTCSVPAPYELSACKFRSPYHNTMIASPGVSQSGYTESTTRYESNAERRSCSLRIINFGFWQEGTWRCAVNTSQGVSYGFLHATAASVADYQPEPVLRSVDVFAWDGEAVAMSCSIDAAIRYCYFRAANGTVFNVGPSISSAHYEYVGSGFDAGDCGIRFNNMFKSDEGNWTCHVGLINDVISDEQRSNFTLQIDDMIWTRQVWDHSTIIVEMNIVGVNDLEYCRFVRIDGLGFTSYNPPVGYYVDPIRMRSGQCVLRVERPGALDRHPWVLAAKLFGRRDEFVRTTSAALLAPLAGMNMVSAVLFWLFFTILLLMLIMAAVSLGPKNNRKWTYARAAHIRNSFRRRPQPAQQTHAVQPNHIDIVTDLPSKV